VQKRLGGMLQRPPKFLQLLYVLLGSLVAVFTILLGKAASELIEVTIAGKSQFNDAFTVLISGMFLVSLPLQVFEMRPISPVKCALYHP